MATSLTPDVAWLEYVVIVPVRPPSGSTQQSFDDRRTRRSSGRGANAHATLRALQSTQLNQQTRRYYAGPTDTHKNFAPKLPPGSEIFSAKCADQ